jgi:hypothetical protein
VIKSADDVVFRHGDLGDSFYIIIKGIVGVRVPNSEIKGWKYEIKRYRDHLKWMQRLEAKYVRIKLSTRKYQEDQKF